LLVPPLAGGVFCGYNRSSATREITIIRTVPAFAALAALSLSGCQTPEQAPPPLRPREVVELQRWTVEADGERLGQLVRFEIRDPSGPVPFYRVLDRRGRWLGHADANGRFSRRVPFEEEEQDLGVWSLEKGCALLFEASAAVSLTEQAPPAVDAVFRRDR